MNKTTNTSKLAPLGHNPVLVAACMRSYRAAVTAEENAPTTEAAWRAAAASQKALRDLQAAQLGQPLPSVVAKLARLAKRAAKRGLAALSNIGKVIARAMTRAAALTRKSIAATLAAALNLTTEGKTMTTTATVQLDTVTSNTGSRYQVTRFRFTYAKPGMRLCRGYDTAAERDAALAEIEADFGRAARTEVA